MVTRSSDLLLWVYVLDHNIKHIYYNRSRSEFGDVLLKAHMDYSIRIKIFVFSVTAVYIRHPFFPGCHSFRSGPISPLGRNLKLQMLELETCGGGCSGENWAA